MYFLYTNILKASTMTVTFKCLMSYRNKNIPCINQCVKNYKFLKIFIYLNPSWSWINDDVLHTHVHMDSFNITTSDVFKYIAILIDQINKIGCVYKSHFGQVILAMSM